MNESDNSNNNGYGTNPTEQSPQSSAEVQSQQSAPSETQQATTEAAPEVPVQAQMPEEPQIQPYDVKGKKVMVVGLARTGVSLVRLLVKLGALKCIYISVVIVEKSK